MIGCKGDRAWVRDANIGRWRDSFFLTGMTLGEAATVWRLSFDGEANTIDASDAGVVVSDVKVELPKQGVAPCDLHFPRAWIGHVADTKATAGVWIVQNRTDGAEEGQLCHVRCGQLGTFPWPSQRVKTDDTCPCESPELCQPVAVQHSKEIFGFLPGPDWRQLDWSTVTTVAWDNTKTNKSQDELVCEAHKHQTRVLAQASPGDGPGGCNLTRFGTNASVRAAFVASTVGECDRCTHPLVLRPAVLRPAVLLHVVFGSEMVKTQHLDGVTFDWECILPRGSPATGWLVQIVNETTTALHAAVPTAMVSVCLPWSPFVPYFGNFDVPGLAAASDLVYVMMCAQRLFHHAHALL